MSAPAGWYPDPQSPAAQRWWDGTQWSAHVQPAPTAWAPPAPAPVQVGTSTPWVWLAIVVSVLPYLTVFLIDWNGYLDSLVRIQYQPSAAMAGMMQWQLSALLVSLLSWVALGAFIVLAWLDWRELIRRGVPAPFSWAWAFFALAGGAAVYMIGRAVVLKRRTESGGWPPLSTWIAVTAVAYVLSLIWTFSMVENMMTRIFGLYS